MCVCVQGLSPALVGQCALSTIPRCTVRRGAGISPSHMEEDFPLYPQKTRDSLSLQLLPNSCGQLFLLMFYLASFCGPCREPRPDRRNVFIRCFSPYRKVELDLVSWWILQMSCKEVMNLMLYLNGQALSPLQQNTFQFHQSPNASSACGQDGS